MTTGQDRESYSDTHVDVREANAHLIAAAPDLLAACEGALAALANGTAEDAATVLIRDGRAAISKARAE